MMTPEAAKRFAERWYAAWNAHDLDGILACYAEGIEHSSPFIARYDKTQEAWVRGKEALRAYFGRTLEANPTLAFHPEHIAVGVQTVVLVYRRHNGDLAAELFSLDAAGKIVRSISHYKLV